MVTKREFRKVGNYVYDPNGEEIGRGAFGSVYKGVEYTNKTNKVAIKIILKSTIEKHRDLLDMFSREIKVLKKIQGKNLLEYLDSFYTSEGNLFIITKFYKDGNLSDYLRNSGGKLPLDKVLKIVKLIAMTFVGLEDLDLRNEDGKRETIFHRDLKPANILMDGDEPILADFGFAKFIPVEKKEEVARHTNGLGTVAYMAPQLLAESPYSYKCDVWSMGIMAYEMIYGVRPWKGDLAYPLLEAIKKESLTFPEEPKVPTYVTDLIKGMLEIEDSARYDWNKIVKALENEPLENKEKYKITLAK